MGSYSKSGGRRLSQEGRLSQSDGISPLIIYHCTRRFRPTLRIGVGVLSGLH